MLEAIESFWLAGFLRRSVIAYPIVNATHILGLGTLAVSAILMDLRVLGAGARLPLNEVIHLLRRVAVTGLGVAILTGLMLFSVQPRAYVVNPVFWIKLTIISLALANAAIFTLRRQHLHPGHLLTRAMAIASILLWLAAIMAGRAIAFFD